MSSYNRVVLLGNLTREPETKYLPDGTAVTDIGLAVNRHYTTKSGEKREEVTFVDISTWGRTAEIVGEYCKKGDPIHVEGRLKLDTWDDKTTGEKRYKLRVVGESVQLLHRSPTSREDDRDHGHRAPAPAAAQRPAPAPQRKPVDPDLDVPEDDIPFRSEEESTKPEGVISRIWAYLRPTLMTS
jgi:single-strand DNA-binding protein